MKNIKDSSWALGITIITITGHHYLFGDMAPWGVIIYFIVYANVKLDNLNT